MVKFLQGEKPEPLSDEEVKFFKALASPNWMEEVLKVVAESDRFSKETLPSGEKRPLTDEAFEEIREALRKRDSRKFARLSWLYDFDELYDRLHDIEEWWEFRGEIPPWKFPQP